MPGRKKKPSAEPLDAYKRVRKPVPPPTKVVPDRRRRILEEEAERERRRGDR